MSLLRGFPLVVNAWLLALGSKVGLLDPGKPHRLDRLIEVGLIVSTVSPSVFSGYKHVEEDQFLLPKSVSLISSCLSVPIISHLLLLN